MTCSALGLEPSSRSPHGERGLKCLLGDHGAFDHVSLSSWRAWIEMISPPQQTGCVEGRSPHGERGLKSRDQGALQHQPAGRSPHGERGLKCVFASQAGLRSGSLSSWRAWIEIQALSNTFATNKSLSSWRAWIEIKRKSSTGERGEVAPRKGSVD